MKSGMKRAVAIVCLLMVPAMLMGLYGCAASYAKSSLSDAEISEIEDALERETGTKYALKNYDGRVCDDAICYGKWVDTAVIFLPTQLCVISSITVADSRFDYSSSFVLYAYRDGELAELREAYEKGWLNDGQIADAARIHREVHSGNQD